MQKFSNVSNFVFCWKIVRKDGASFYFTNHVSDITINNIVYSSSFGFAPNEIIKNIKVEQKSFEIEGIIDDVRIKADDLIDGLYDEASVECIVVDGELPENGYIVVKTGYINDIYVHDKIFVAEICDNISIESGSVCSSYSYSCRANFGDSFCKVNVEKYSFIGSIEKIISDNVFFDSKITKQSGYYNGGLVTFLDGSNNAMYFVIRKQIDSMVVLESISNVKFAIGDKYKMVVGCNKLIDTCFDKFDNTLNFRGEPFVNNVFLS